MSSSPDVIQQVESNEADTPVGLALSTAEEASQIVEQGAELLDCGGMASGITSELAHTEALLEQLAEQARSGVDAAIEAARGE